MSKIVFNFGENSSQNADARELSFASVLDLIFALRHRGMTCASAGVVPTGVFHPKLPDHVFGAKWVLYDALRRIMTAAKSGKSILGTVELRAKLPNPHGIQSGYLVSSLEWFALPEESPFGRCVYIRVRHRDPNEYDSEQGHDVSFLTWGVVYVGSEAPIVMTHGELFPTVEIQKSHTLGALWEQGLSVPLLPYEPRISPCTTLYSVGNVLLAHGGYGASSRRPTYALTPGGPQEVSLTGIRKKLVNLGGLALTPKILLHFLSGGELPGESLVAKETARVSGYPAKGSLYRRVASALIDRSVRQQHLRVARDGQVGWDSWKREGIHG